MRQEGNNIFLNLDWTIILLYLILIGFGWLNIYAASSTNTSHELFDFSTKYGKQILWIGLSFPLIVFILFFNAKFYERFASVLYLVSIIMLIGVLIFGKKINGATSWYNFGGISLQPSEFAKVFTALAVAKLMNDRQYNLNLIKNQIKAFIIIFTPAMLIALQPDMGSVLIYFAFFFVLNREGLPFGYILIGLLAIVIFLTTIYLGAKWTYIVFFVLITIFAVYIIYKTKQKWNSILFFLFIYLSIGGYIMLSNFAYTSVLSSHQKDRFDILLGLKVDNSGIGYNSYQSELTIRSGGFLGKGFLQGDRTQGDFVPEQHTDYIFSTVGEEWGFLGSSMVIILFMALLFRIIYLSEKTHSKFGRIYGYGVASILFFHVAVNIGMVIGILPTIGIPLPFFSYGGSSLWGFTLLIFIFIRLDAHKKYEW